MFVRYQTEKKTKVLRLVPGKGPLKDCTSAIINLPPDPSQSNPLVTENEVITVPDGSEDSNVPDGLQDTASPCLEDESNNQPTGCLGDLFEDLPIIDSETLGDKINRVLEHQKTLFSNQKVFFSFMSQLVRDVHNISKSLVGMGVGSSMGRQEGGSVQQDQTPCFSLGSQVDFSPRLSLGSGEGYSVCREREAWFTWIKVHVYHWALG